MRSRPRRAWHTSPAPASTCRCLVTAWPVTAEPSLSRVIDSGPPAESRATSPRRVPSPSAANTEAAPGAGRACALALDIPADVLRLHAPPHVVHPVRLGTARDRDALEAGLDDRQQCSALGVREAELDQRGRLTGVIDRRVDRIRPPAIGEQPLGFHPLDRDLHRDVLVAGVRDPAAHGHPLAEAALELDQEPRSEL